MTGEPAEGGPVETGQLAEPGAAARRPATSLLTWGTAALVLVVVVALIVIKVTAAPSASTTSAAVAPAPAAPSVVKAVTAVPESVFDTVGVTSSDATLTPPTVLHGQPPLTSDGKPEVVFVGNEFCPYCAAERWVLVVALSRFGTFGDTLYASQSGSNEVFSSTPTFTFDGARYRSKYLSATLVEHYGDQKDGAGTGYAVLEPLPPAEKALLGKYDRQTPGAPGGIVPFVDVADEATVAGGQFSPSVLQQLSADEIAAGLTDPEDPATQAIVASANYLSAAICHADGGLPARVCTGSGVAAAGRAVGLSP